MSFSLRLTIWAVHLMWNSFTLSTPKMRFLKRWLVKASFMKSNDSTSNCSYWWLCILSMLEIIFWNFNSKLINYLINSPLCAFYQEYYNLWNSNNRWISNLKVALTMFLKMIPSIASNYYLKILLDRIVTKTYLYIIMNCFLVSLCVSGFVYH